MQLIKADPIEAQPAQTPIQFLSQAIWMRVPLPLVRPRSIETTFGGDDESRRIRIQSFSDQLLADVRPVRFRGIDQRDLQLDRTAQRRDRLRPIRGRSPHALSCDPHRAESKTMDWQVATEKKSSAKRGRGHAHG